MSWLKDLKRAINRFGELETPRANGGKPLALKQATALILPTCPPESKTSAPQASIYLLRNASTPVNWLLYCSANKASGQITPNCNSPFMLMWRGKVKTV